MIRGLSVWTFSNGIILLIWDQSLQNYDMNVKQVESVTFPFDLYWWFILRDLIAAAGLVILLKLDWNIDFQWNYFIDQRSVFRKLWHKSETDWISNIHVYLFTAIQTQTNAFLHRLCSWQKLYWPSPVNHAQWNIVWSNTAWFFSHPKWQETNGIQGKLSAQLVTCPYPRDMFSSKYPLYVIIDQSYWFNSWGWVTHICVSKLTIIGWDNGLSPVRRQAIIWTNAGIVLIGTLGTNFSEILSEIHIFSFNIIHLKMSSGKRQPFVSASMCWRYVLHTTLR